MARSLAQYFGLETSALGGPSGTQHQIVLFSGVLAGSMGQWGFAVMSGGQFSWKSLVLGMIASIVTFPTIFYNAGLNRTKVSIVKWCVAFQNGFFWPTILSALARNAGSQ